MNSYCEYYQQLIREEFLTKIEQKTNWGNKILRIEFERALAKAAIRMFDEKHSDFVKGK